MVHQRLQEEAFVWAVCDARRWAGSHLGLHFQNLEQKSGEGGRPKRTAAWIH